MHIIFALLLAMAGFFIPSTSFAESADTEGVIEGIDEDHLVLTLSDGKRYQVPQEFNFDGLEKGLKVMVFYTDTHGRREINDLQILQ